MQITAHSEMAGKDGQATTVGARKLQDLLRALPDDATLNIDVGNNKMTVRAGRSRFNLQTLAAGGLSAHQARHASSCRRCRCRRRTCARCSSCVEFAMAQQDIRYYLNGMLLVVDKGSLQAVATDGHRLSWASIGVAGELRAPGSDPAAQDGARARQAARRQRRPRHARHPGQPGALPLRQRRAREQGGRRQVPRFQPRDPGRPRQAHRARAPRAPGGAAARRDPVATRSSAACASCSAPTS